MVGLLEALISLQYMNTENVNVFHNQKPGCLTHTLETSILSGLVIAGAAVLPQLQRLALLGCNAPIGSVFSLNFPFLLEIKN